MIEALAALLSREERAAGGPALARHVHATHLCLFLLDPELHKFLPAPGFPQTMPSGLRWQKFLADIPEGSSAISELVSPYSESLERISAFRFQRDAIVVLFGPNALTRLSSEFCSALALIAGLLLQEVYASLALTRASLSYQNALQADMLARSLSEAHDRLSEALRTKNFLLEDLRQKEARLELARQISGMGVWEWNMITNKIHPGTGFLEMHGLSPEEGTNFEKVISSVHPDDRAKVLEELHSAVRGQREYDVQFRVVWKNGIVRNIAARAIAVKDELGKPRALVGFTIDITNRLMIENALIRSEKLAAAGRLAASIAHEINNPLASIVNVVYLAKREKDQEKLREFLEMADRELLRIAAVTRQTLRFYQDSNRPSRFDLHTAIEEVVQLYSKQIHESGVQVSIEFRTKHTELEGWSGEIKQVISNLLLNALHATKPQKRVILRLKKTQSGFQLTLADRGSGVAKEQRNRIFEPFYSTKKETGTGLGLWVTQQIVSKHGGWIRMKSRISRSGSGTVFTVFLPFHKKAEESLHAKWQGLNAESA